MKQNKPNKLGTVRYRSDGSKITTVSFDGDIDYRAKMNELNKRELEANAQPDMATPEEAA